MDRLISSAWLKRGDAGRALELSAGAIDVDPANPDAYRQYAASLIAAGRREQAITVLMEGVMLTMDSGLRQNGGWALMPGHNDSMALNTGCEVVHSRLCGHRSRDATPYERRRRDLAEQLKVSGVNNFRCPVNLLESALAAR